MIEIHMGVFSVVLLNKGKSHLTTKVLGRSPFGDKFIGFYLLKTFVITSKGI